MITKSLKDNVQLARAALWIGVCGMLSALPFLFLAAVGGPILLCLVFYAVPIPPIVGLISVVMAHCVRKKIKDANEKPRRLTAEWALFFGYLTLILCALTCYVVVYHILYVPCRS